MRLEKGTFRSVAGTHWGSPKEIWGFRAKLPRGSALGRAKAFVAGNQELLALEGAQGSLGAPRIVESLAATHVILRQRVHGVPVHRGYVTVHLDPDGRAYLVKNRAAPRRHWPEKRAPQIGAEAAVARARRYVGMGKNEGVEFEPALRWLAVGPKLELAWRVRLRKTAPTEEWIVYVDAKSRRVHQAWDNLSLARGRGRVFDPNPVIALGSHHQCLGAKGKPKQKLDARAYSEVTLTGLDGKGRLDGRRVTTRTTAKRLRRPDLDFRVASRSEPGFKEVMAYFHIDRALAYLEGLGFRGDRTVLARPIPVNVEGTKEDNSWYSPGEKALSFGTGGVDDAEDAETILHELGHAIQDAICPDFGQSAQSAAMGEGFGDYLAASFFEAKKPAAYRTSVMSWDAITYPDYEPPCLRRVDDELSFEDFDHSADADEHENGRIWSSTLWAVRGVLGREGGDRAIVESHFQLDGFTTFARAARAILDADRHLYAGRHRAALERVFVSRGIGPVR